MYNITQLKTGTKIIYGGQPHLVLSYTHSKVGRGGAIVKTKLKNLISGTVIDKTFKNADKFEPARLNHKNAQYLYSDNDSAHFMDSETFEQFEISLTHLGQNKIFLKEESKVSMLYFNNQPINVELPIRMKFLVVSAPPSIKGNSAGAVSKKVECENGLSVEVPIFIKEGDEIVVDTRDGSYIARQ